MKKSIILALTLVIMAVLLVLGAGYTTYFVHEKKSSDRNLAALRAFYIAEAGLDKSLSNLRSGLSGNLSEDFGNGNYVVTVSSISSTVYKIHSVAEAEDNQDRVLATRTLEMYVKNEPFNTYSYLTDDEYYTRTYCILWWCWTVQEPVWFVTGDRLEGPTFTNSEYHISGDPEFYGQVQSVADEIIYMNGGPPNDNPYFDPSYSPNPNLGVNPINLPTYNDDPDLQDLESEGEQFSGDTTIEFQEDGTMNVTNSARGWNNHNTAIPANKGVIVTGGNLYVSGRVNGEVTIGAAEDGSGNGGNVVVEDNLRYNDRYDGASLREGPYLPEDSDDYLGVVAEKNIVIDKDAPNNLEINGSMMALGDSFIVERWYDSGYNKDTLMVLGGIIQNERGPVGTFSGDTKISGYNKNYIYDERLGSQYLPFFPRTTVYTVKSWGKE